MAFTLWLSAEEDQILGQIMRLEGIRDREEAVITAIRDKGARLLADKQREESAGPSVTAADLPSPTPPVDGI